MNLLSFAFRSARAFDGGPISAGPLPPDAAEADPYAAPDEPEEVEWVDEPMPSRRCRPSPTREWLFWALLMCTAMIALPLIGSRWTLPETALSGDASGDVLLLALPAVLALPLLLTACVAELWRNRAARTPAAVSSFALALLLALAALPAWLA